MAVLNACMTIRDRLQPLRKSHPSALWEEIVQKAYLQRINLSANGFYATPNIGYDRKTRTGSPFAYFSYGVACSEVEIDVLTGDHVVLRTDIIMDVGKSINPAIDVGQVEGAFIQGLGLFTIEEMQYTPSGQVLTRGPGTYKIPSFSSIPEEWNVALLRDAPNDRAVYASKAVGEPPLFLAASVYLALHAAIRAARYAAVGIAQRHRARRGASLRRRDARRRRDAQLALDFRLDSPATAERIRLACGDPLVARVPHEAVAPRKGWNMLV